MIEELLLSTMRLSVPLIFAALGGLMCERSGIANIALEALLLFAAFASGAVTYATNDASLGIAAGLACAALVGAAFGAICLWGRGDQIVVGTGLNLLAAGLIPVLTKGLFDRTGSTPALEAKQTFHEPIYFFIASIAIFVLLEFLFRRTRHGLRITAAGENPLALRTQGVSDRAVRLRAVIEGSLIAGVGGVYLALCQGSGYVREMSAGRGFIALAALIFGAWKPWTTLLACLFFAFLDAIQIRLQGTGVIPIPNQFIQILPYLATLLVLIFANRRVSAPAAINRDI
jgi:simple sugar transport system permease protein